MLLLHILQNLQNSPRLKLSLFATEGPITGLVGFPFAADALPLGKA